MTMRRANQGLGVLTVLIGAYIGLMSSTLPTKAAQMPNILALTLAVLGTLLIVLNTVVSPTREHLETRPFSNDNWGLWTLVVVMLLLYGAVVVRVGFYEMAVLFVAVISLAMMRGETKPLGYKVGVAVVYAVLFSAGLYMVFEWVLNVPTPPGLLV